LPGIIGLIQATEILKLILGKGTSLLNRLLLFNALDMQFRELKLRRDPQCPLCGKSPTITQLIDYENFCGVPPPSTATTMHPDEITVHDLKKSPRQPAARHPGARCARAGRIPDCPHQRRASGAAEHASATLHRAGPESRVLHSLPRWRPLLKALQFLREQGFKNLKSVKGGIAAWSDEIDPTVPKY